LRLLYNVSQRYGRITMTDKVKYTVDEFDQFISLPENRDRSFELINGEIIEEMPTFMHGLIIHLLMFAIGKYFEKHPIGWVVPEVRFQLPNESDYAFIPDLAVVLRAEGRKPIKKGATPYMPDLAIEVQSPDQSEAELVNKAAEYLKRGSKMVWNVYPEKEAVEVFTASGRQLLTRGQMLDGGDVLPDFTIPVENIFLAE